MKYKLSYFVLMLFVGVIFFSACKKKDPDQWLKDNITVIGKLPNIASISVVPPATAGAVVAGSNIVLDLRYWSEDAIDKINLTSKIGTIITPISSTNYSAAFSKISRTDSLLLNYAVPTGLASGTAITMEVEVVNKNTLSRKSTIALKVQ